jgi:glycosyltransferase involved in cell wall biosynthesis
MSKKIYLHATNVSQGGGRTLLTAVLEALPDNVAVVAQLDSRMVLPKNFSDKVVIRFVRPTLLGRILADLWLSRNVTNSDIAICFGSLPPLFKLKGLTLVFVQNRYLIEKNMLESFPPKTRIRLMLERTWFRLASSNADEYIVQTPTMKAIMHRLGYINNRPIKIRPFIANSLSYTRSGKSIRPNARSDYDFIYVATGEPHKNHKNLVEAWCILADQNLYPSILLTLDKAASAMLCAWIDYKVSNFKLNLTNAGLVSHSSVIQLYSQAGALIYPSRLESFGLPLIEASMAGIPILASELDYVRDVIDPIETFDSSSPLSIARAVKRFMGYKEDSLSLLNASEFFEVLINKERP